MKPICKLKFRMHTAVEKICLDIYKVVMKWRKKRYENDKSSSSSNKGC